jgi:hypothetical protein
VCWRLRAREGGGRVAKALGAALLQLSDSEHVAAVTGLSEWESKEAGRRLARTSTDAGCSAAAVPSTLLM